MNDAEKKLANAIRENAYFLAHLMLTDGMAHGRTPKGIMSMRHAVRELHLLASPDATLDQSREWATGQSRL